MHVERVEACLLRAVRGKTPREVGALIQVLELTLGLDNILLSKHEDHVQTVSARDISEITRVRTQLSHQATVAAMAMDDMKMSARLSYRVAMRRKSFSRQNMRSITFRPR